jgi:hypothetical protein
VIETRLPDHRYAFGAVSLGLLQQRAGCQQRRCHAGFFAAINLIAALGCGEGQTQFIGSHHDSSALDSVSNGTGMPSSSTTGSSPNPVTPTDCRVDAIPADLGAPAFYSKYTDAAGIPVISSPAVPDNALTQACLAVTRMLAKRADILAKMVDNGARVAIIARDEGLHDLPELADLSSDWVNTRGIGATSTRPLT